MQRASVIVLAREELIGAGSTRVFATTGCLKRKVALAHSTPPCTNIGLGEDGIVRTGTLAALAIAGTCGIWALGAAGQEIEAGATQASSEPGVTPVGDVIFARRVLMGAIDIYMQEIEAFAQDAEEDGTPIPFEAAEAADIVSTKLLAFPHLFPAGSGIWSKEAEEGAPTSVSLAMPAVWENFPDFYPRANQASQKAFDLSRMTPRDDAWIAAARDLQIGRAHV